MSGKPRKVISPLLTKEGAKAQAEPTDTPPEVDKACAFLLGETAGGKSGLGAPSHFTPRRVRRPDCNRGPGRLSWYSFFCQCQQCLDTFSIDGLVRNNRVLKLEKHPHIVHNGNGTYHHLCGGELRLYPSLEFRRIIKW